ncbi:diguanylate cyclase [Allochromatium palmeri]|uniref:diguanylate cyclase n=1 Tax=Allochromatium palmeri TaxID=231048 RepID=UPI0016423F9B
MQPNNQPDTPPLTLVSTAGPSHRQPSEPIDTIRFLQAVTASLELDEVLNALNDFLYDLVAHSGWEYQCPTGEPCFSGGKSDPHRVEYSLTLNAQNLGVFRIKRGRRFSEEDQRRIEGLLALATPAIQNALRFWQVNRQLERDPLTGLGNRRALSVQGEQWLADSLRHRHPISMLVLDLDRFKAVNDTYGHPVGDRVLCKVAETLLAVTRTADLCVRLGGDEFVVLLPDSDLTNALECAERIQHALSQQFVETESDHHIGISASIGAAAYRSGMDFEQLYRQADEALYVAKSAHDRPVRTCQATSRSASSRRASAAETLRAE